MTTPKKMGDYYPPLKEQGISHLVAAAGHGVGIQAKQIVQVGAPPFSVVFADHGMADMADDAYVVNVNGETVAATHVDQSTLATTGFDVLGGANDEVLHIIIVGRLAGQMDEDGNK